jgi:TolB protein
VDPARERIAATRRTAIWILSVAVIFGMGAVFWTLGTGEPSFDGAPAWSPDGRQLVFTVESAGQSDIWTMTADGTHRNQLTDTRANEAAPAFSPDGQRIAFESNRDGNDEIYTMALDGTDVRRLTTHRSADHAPAWSPEGETMAFVSDRGGAGQSDIYLMTRTGTGIRRLTSGGQFWSPQFSPNGLEITAQGGKDVFVITTATGARRRLTFDPQNGMFPTWSRDGATLAFASTRRSRLELFTMDLAGSNQQVLLSMPGGSAMDPRWSPDGTRIAFVYVPQLDDASDDTPQPYAIYLLDIATKKVTRLSP